MRKRSDENEGLLIDRAAAAELPSTDGIREWAREKRAFISSVMTELQDERRAVAAGVRAVGMRPVMFEEFGDRDADPEGAYLPEVESSDIYIGILGHHDDEHLREHGECGRGKRDEDPGNDVCNPRGSEVRELCKSFFRQEVSKSRR
jgi:hypothetical protein